MCSAANCGTISVTLEIVRIAVPALLVIAGWFVASHFQRKAAARQDTRKEIGARLESLQANLRELRDNCIEYYTDASKGPELSTPIKFLVDDVREQTLVLQREFLSTVDADLAKNHLLEVMRAATGGAFETRNRKASNAFDHQLSKLSFESSRLFSLFEKAYLSSYKPTK